MSIGYRVLTALSYRPGVAGAGSGAPEWSVEDALSLLDAAFPTLTSQLAGRSVLDFGCGTGYQCVALARAGARRVVGLDTNERTLAAARALAREHGVADRVELRATLAESDLAAHDLVFSQNSMEHFPDPLAVLRQMTRALAPGGRICVVFGPPWFAPRGSHMQFFTPVPWVNLLFRERTVLRVRARYKSDGARRYEEVESGLNRMTVGRFERVVREAGLVFVRRRYRCVKRLSFLGRLPVLRELFINEVHAELAAGADENGPARARGQARRPGTYAGSTSPGTGR